MSTSRCEAQHPLGCVEHRSGRMVAEHGDPGGVVGWSVSVLLAGPGVQRCGVGSAGQVSDGGQASIDGGVLAGVGAGFAGPFPGGEEVLGERAAGRRGCGTASTRRCRRWAAWCSARPIGAVLDHQDLARWRACRNTRVGNDEDSSQTKRLASHHSKEI